MSSNLDSDIKLINTIHSKLVSDSSPKLKKKCHEYLRLLQLKRGTGLLNMSDTCAVVVCLDLAADKLGSTFDRPQAFKVAGVTKKNYLSLYHTVEKVLGLDHLLTVSELCVKLACADVSELAQRLLDCYVDKRGKGLVKCPPIDLSHPMYSCAAVLAACRHRKVKVKRGALVELCRVKARDLDNLAGELATLAAEMGKPPSRKRAHHLIDMVEQMVAESQKTPVSMREEEENSDKPQESFDEWKKRILAENT